MQSTVHISYSSQTSTNPQFSAGDNTNADFLKPESYQFTAMVKKVIQKCKCLSKSQHHSEQFRSKQHNCKFTSENMNDCFDSVLQVHSFSKHHCLLDLSFLMLIWFYHPNQLATTCIKKQHLLKK